MDTESLKLFVLAADKLNITAAGRELGLAPAVASARLAKLEKQVGADLLHRTTRKVSLSFEGREFLPYAREILAQENAAFAALGHGSATVTGTLRFAASSTFAQLYIIPLLPEFMQRFPDIHLDLRLSDTQFELIEGSFDLALRNTALVDSSLRGRRLAEDVRVLCAAPDYLSQHGVPKVPADLQHHQLVGFQSQAARPLRNLDGDVGEFNPRKAGGKLVLDDGLSQKLATMAGVGVSSNSLWSVAAELRAGSLVRVLPDYEVNDQSGLWLLYPKSNVLTAKVRVFIDFLLEKIGDPPLWETARDHDVAS